MAKDTMTFEMEGVGTWEIPIPVATTIEGLADERVAFLARAEAAEAYLERIRVAMGGFRDSNLASLAETLRARCDALEVENARLRDQVAALEAEVERLRAALADCWTLAGLEREAAAHEPATGERARMEDAERARRLA